MASITPSDPRGGRLWVVTETYWPELTSTGYFLTAIAEGLAAEFDVAALCGQPTYAARGIRAARRERLHGVDVIRVHGTTFDKNHRYLRWVNLLTLTLAKFFELLARLRRRDVVLVVTNPPTAPYVARVASWLRGARCVLLVHDVYPDALVAARMLAPDTLAVRVIGVAARTLLRSMDAICVLGRDMADLIRPRAGRTPVHITPNWAGDDIVEGGDPSPNPFRASLDLTDRFVIQYAGNIGGVQDVDTIVRAAAKLQNLAPRIHLLFIGSGRKKRWLQESISTLGLRNVTVVDELPRTEQAVFLRACDAAVMAFVPGMRGVGVPSRLYNILASGRPVIAAVDPQSEPALVIQEEAVGWVIPPGDVEAMVAAMMTAEQSSDTVRQMGRRAGAAARAKYRRADILREYRRILGAFGLRRAAPAAASDSGLEQANVL